MNLIWNALLRLSNFSMIACNELMNQKNMPEVQSDMKINLQVRHNDRKQRFSRNVAAYMQHFLKYIYAILLKFSLYFYI